MSETPGLLCLKGAPGLQRPRDPNTQSRERSEPGGVHTSWGPVCAAQQQGAPLARATPKVRPRACSAAQRPGALGFKFPASCACRNTGNI